MTPKVIDFELWHLGAISAREINPIKSGIPFMTRHRWFARSGEFDGKIIGSAGIIETAPQTGYAFVVVSRDIEAWKIWFHRQVKKRYWQAKKELGLKMVYADVLTNSQRNCRWIERFGFRVKDPDQTIEYDGESYLRYIDGVS